MRKCIVDGSIIVFRGKIVGMLYRNMGSVENYDTGMRLIRIQRVADGKDGIFPRARFRLATSQEIING